MAIDEAELKQSKFLKELKKLRAYPARGSKYIDLKESVSKDAKKFYDGWEKIAMGFKNGILPLFKSDDTETDSGDQPSEILDT